MFHVDKCIHVHEYLQENLIHQGIVDLECILLVVKINSVQAFLIQVKVRLSISNGSSGNHLLIKVWVSAISR